jgi:3-oxoacyl-[acyl-carrier-protein] synthase-1
MAVICFNRSASLTTDRLYEQTIRDEADYFPSPSLFVYTLPNIVIGEIAIRNRLFGETAFYVCPTWDEPMILQTLQNAFLDPQTRCLLAAWIECAEPGAAVHIMLVEAGAPDDESGTLDMEIN